MPQQPVACCGRQQTCAICYWHSQRQRGDTQQRRKGDAADSAHYLHIESEADNSQPGTVPRKAWECMCWTVQPTRSAAIEGGSSMAPLEHLDAHAYIRAHMGQAMQQTWGRISRGVRRTWLTVRSQPCPSVDSGSDCCLRFNCSAPWRVRGLVMPHSRPTAIAARVCCHSCMHARAMHWTRQDKTRWVRQNRMH